MTAGTLCKSTIVGRLFLRSLVILGVACGLLVAALVSAPQIAAAEDLPPVAQLRVPGPNFLIVPDHALAGRDHFNLVGVAVGSSYRIELYRHISCRAARCTPYSSEGALLWTLVSGVNPSFLHPASLLGRVEPDGVFSPANVKTPDVPGTSGWDEGEYTVKLTVTKSGFPDAVSSARVYVDRSHDPAFNPDPVSGVGGPRLLQAVVFGDPYLVDLTGDGNPEIVLGSASHKGVYAFDLKGDLIFQSAPVPGRILGTPAGGDLDGNDAGRVEIVVTGDVSAGASLHVFDLPDTLSSATPCFDVSLPPCPEAFPVLARSFGNVRSSPVVGRAFPEDPRDSIFLTTRNNFLHWFDGASNRFTTTGLSTLDVCPPGTEDFCGRGLELMESRPFLLPGSPSKIYVPSQASFTTYGFELTRDADGVPVLSLLPGFPLPWTSATEMAPGGNFDITQVGGGSDEMFNVRYSRGASPADDRSQIVTFGPDGVIHFASVPLDDLIMFSGAASAELRPDSEGMETVVIGMSGKVYLLSAQGTILSGWPVQMDGRSAGTPVIVDLDGDGIKEILTTSSDRLLYAWDPYGVPKRTLFGNSRYGFPRALMSAQCHRPQSKESPFRSWPVNEIIRCTSPVVGQFDADPGLEIVMVAAAGSISGNALHMWELTPPKQTLTPSLVKTLHRGSPSSLHTVRGGVDPVDLATGSYVLQHRDVVIPTLGLPLDFTRTYHSAAAGIEGPLGFGWTHSYQMAVLQDATGDRIVRMPDGRLDRYVDDGNGAFAPPPGIYNRLIRHADDTFTVITKARETYVFDTSGHLVEVSDSNGNTTTLAYTGVQLTSVTAPDGRRLTFDYDADGRIIALTDTIGRKTTYAYDGSGNLVSVTNPVGHLTTFTYDTDHRLTSITDLRGNNDHHELV